MTPAIDKSFRTGWLFTSLVSMLGIIFDLTRAPSR